MTTIQRIRVPAGFAYAGVFLYAARPQLFHAWAGIALAAIGLGIRIWAAGYLKKDKELAVDGPYAWIRNPLYFGSFLLGLGLSLASGRPALLVAFTILFVAIYLPVMKKEEEELVRSFGARYGTYRQQVPLFWPGFRKKQNLPPRTPRQFEWRGVVLNREYRAVAGFALLVAFLFIRMPC